MQKILSRVSGKVNAKMSSQPQPQPQPQAQQPLQANTTTTSAQLALSLKNDSIHKTVYVYVTGQAIDAGNKLFLLKSDARSPYYPTSPSKIGSSLNTDCGIKLGEPGTTVHATIPHIAGGRIWFSYDKPLTFLLNPGPALVEPSVTNQSDPNYHLSWGFCEFTYNSAQLFANISYVDFVSLPIALSLASKNGTVKHVSGMRADGLVKVAEGLQAQAKKDGRAWDKLVIKDSGGGVLRALSPNAGHVIEGDILNGYYSPYVDKVWAAYSSAELQVNTQGQYGTLSARVKSDQLTFSDGTTFTKPSTADIFSCSTGPFASSDPSKLALIPRIAAALNRSTLLQQPKQPDSSGGDFYKETITNHYSRIVHANNVDKRGYAFPYDDVVGSEGTDVAGTVFDGEPTEFTIAVGGRNAYK